MLEYNTRMGGTVTFIDEPWVRVLLLIHSLRATKR